MISAICIANGNIVQQNHLAEKKNIEAKPKLGVLAGKKTYIKTNPRTRWISLIASAIVVTLGITLIAAITSAGAIAGGVSLIVLSLIGCAYFNLRCYAREIALENEMKKQLSLKLKYKEDFSDLPKIHWDHPKGRVIIKITDEQIAANRPLPGEAKHFIANCKDIQELPFITTLLNKNGDILLNATVFDRHLKGEPFAFALQGVEMPLKDSPHKI